MRPLILLALLAGCNDCLADVEPDEEVFLPAPADDDEPGPAGEATALAAWPDGFAVAGVDEAGGFLRRHDGRGKQVSLVRVPGRPRGVAGDWLSSDAGLFRIARGQVTRISEESFRRLHVDEHGRLLALRDRFSAVRFVGDFIDPTFQLDVDVSPDVAEETATALASRDGHVWLAGTLVGERPRVALIQSDEHGGLISGFGEHGRLIFGDGHEAAALVVDGRTVVAGSVSQAGKRSWFTAAIDAEGTPPSLHVVDFASSDDELLVDAAFLGHDLLLIGGASAPRPSLAVALLDPAGKLVPGFDGDGKDLVRFPGDARPVGVAVLAGRSFLIGSERRGGSSSLVVRLLMLPAPSGRRDVATDGTDLSVPPPAD